VPIALRALKELPRHHLQEPIEQMDKLAKDIIQQCQRIAIHEVERLSQQKIS
jgi:hypothetical protein